ncbi:MAG: hypothetical protein WAV28_05700 [Sedimentisphaerales bacterium]
MKPRITALVGTSYSDYHNHGLTRINADLLVLTPGLRVRKSSPWGQVGIVDWSCSENKYGVPRFL